MTTTTRTFDYAKLAHAVLHESDPAVAVSLRHNLALLRAIHWGARGVLASNIDFDPRTRWWHPPERRFLVAFLSDTWPDWPSDESKHAAVEQFSVALSVALDRLRERGKISFLGVEYEQGGGIAKVLAPVRGVVENFDDHGWTSCRPRKHGDRTAAQALLAFLKRVERDDFSEHERSLQQLMRWWAVLGARSPAQLVERQSFFWRYRLLLCSSNAYVNAGAQYFGPVIGNTEVRLFREVIRRWCDGITPNHAPLMAHDKDTDELSNRSHTNIARELWGFLNLHRGPFYNAQADIYLEYNKDPIDATLQIGTDTRSWLAKNPDIEIELSDSFATWLARAQRSGQQPLAKVRRYNRRFDAQGNAIDRGAPLDMLLNAELVDQGTKSLLDQFSRTDRAAVMLHLALDAVVRPHDVGESDSDSDSDDEDGLTYTVPRISVSARDGRSGPASPDASARLRAAKAVWIYAPGGQASGFKGDLEHKLARVYWDQIDDLRGYATPGDLFAKLAQLRGQGSPSPFNDSKTLWTFSHVQAGDVVIARRGLRTVVGVGEVTKPYFYVPHEKGRHRLEIDWFWTGEVTLTSGKKMSMRTFVDGTPRKVLLALLERELRGNAVDEHDEQDEDTSDLPNSKELIKPFDIDDALHDLFFTRDQVEKWKRLLERRHNLVLTGPPGVGKTFVAKRLAQLLTGKSSDHRIQIVQFHQAYSYEQFVLGYRPAAPSENAGSQPQFELAKGPLFRLAEQAIKESDESFVLIIDEVNRGNISRILGEALMLLESDKRSEEWGLKLAYAVGDSEFNEGKFFLPPNLYVIGTMNTADRSLAVVDYALRRRFAFVDVTSQIDSPQFEAHTRAQQLPAPVLARLRERVGELNHRIENDRALGNGFSIGHSFFTVSDGSIPWIPTEASTKSTEQLAHEWLDDVFECEIEPLVREYWAEHPKQCKDALAELWKGSSRP